MIYRYSGIETANRCLRKFKLDYIDKLPQEGQPSIELVFGTGMHSALQASLEGDNAQHVFKTYWDSLRKDLAHEKYRYGDYAEKAKVFLRKFDTYHKKHLTPHHLERTLACEINGLGFEGTPDFIGLYKGVPSILDFKTSQYPYPKEKVLSNPQMPLYAQMAKQVLGFEAQQIVYLVFIKQSTSIQEPIVEKLTKKLLTEALDSVISRAETIEKETAFPKNFTACVIGNRVCSRFKHCYGG